jgi:hypothetical protein
VFIFLVGNHNFLLRVMIKVSEKIIWMIYRRVVS